MGAYCFARGALASNLTAAQPCFTPGHPDVLSGPRSCRPAQNTAVFKCSAEVYRIHGGQIACLDAHFTKLRSTG